MSLVDAAGKPLNGAKVETAPAPRGVNPTKEVSKIIRILEASRRISLEDTCSTLEAVAMSGWQLTIDEKLPTTRAEITIVSHLSRNADGQLNQVYERWVRLGSDFTQALLILKEYQEKELAKDAAQETALAAKKTELAGD